MVVYLAAPLWAAGWLSGCCACECIRPIVRTDASAHSAWGLEVATVSRQASMRAKERRRGPGNASSCSSVCVCVNCCTRGNAHILQQSHFLLASHLQPAIAPSVQLARTQVTLKKRYASCVRQLVLILCTKGKGRATVAVANCNRLTMRLRSGQMNNSCKWANFALVRSLLRT